MMANQMILASMQYRTGYADSFLVRSSLVPALIKPRNLPAQEVSWHNAFFATCRQEVEVAVDVYSTKGEP